jgi:hypothetical protein
MYLVSTRRRATTSCVPGRRGPRKRRTSPGFTNVVTPVADPGPLTGLPSGRCRGSPVEGNPYPICSLNPSQFGTTPMLREGRGRAILLCVGSSDVNDSARASTSSISTTRHCTEVSIFLCRTEMISLKLCCDRTVGNHAHLGGRDFVLCAAIPFAT